ncbi:MAG: DUF4280 domain-containing protein [Candidatus Electrothrix sp. AX5]|nr:DUF4280 domain-containing protein [Candidatus Electrothrix sp. AX5]
MPLQVVNGAILTCSMGLAPGSLMVLPIDREFSSSQPAATIMDNIPLLNIAPFGMCISLANPTVAAATVAAMGVLTPMPCIPNTPAPWAPGQPTVTLGNKPVLDNTCKLNCMWAGVIQVIFPGQVTHMTGGRAESIALIEKIKSGKSNIKVQGTAQFKKDTYAALARLASTPTGLKLLKALDSNSNTTTIKEENVKGNTEVADSWSDGLYDRTKKKPGPGTNTTVKFNPQKDKIGGGSEAWQTRDPAIGLAHELIHAYHDTHGTTDGRTSVTYTDDKGKKHKAPGYEHQAVGLGEYKDNEFTENKIRKEFNDEKVSIKNKESQRPRY